MRYAGVFLLLLTTATFAAAQRPRIQTATRFVTIFSNLENQLADALASSNTAGAERLVASDFSEWTPTPPADPTAREEWLKGNHRDMANARIRQMSVKDLGDRAAANFVLVAGAKAWFIVDIWRKSGTDWQLEARYAAPVNAAPFRGPRRPTGKE